MFLYHFLFTLSNFSIIFHKMYIINNVFVSFSIKSTLQFIYKFQIHLRHTCTMISCVLQQLHLQGNTNIIIILSVPKVNCTIQLINFTKNVIDKYM